jgi:hypothetical protein
LQLTVKLKTSVVGAGLATAPTTGNMILYLFCREKQMGNGCFFAKKPLRGLANPRIEPIFSMLMQTMIQGDL